LPRRVLVVEDESLVAILVEDLVADLGCVVVGPVSTAAQAKALAETGDIDIALLDINLGRGETSFEAAEILRGRGVPFAFVTGYGRQGVRPDLRDAPVIDKPIDPDVLRRFLAG
jgi:CheY-like chemotaxis protein